MRRRGLLTALAGGLALCALMAGPVRADEHDHDHYRHHRHYYHERAHYRPYYYQTYSYDPGYYYTPPPLYVAPPPPSAGLNLVFPLHFH
jgi:hypothetical protein